MNVWIKNIGRADFEQMDKGRLRRSFRVCHAHFAKEAHYVGVRNRTKINPNAIPTLFFKKGSNCLQICKLFRI